MIKKIACALALTALASSAQGQNSVTFQNGITPLPGGGFYQGTEDTQFRSLEPGLSTSLGEEPEITVDGDDNLNLTQGAIRFTNLLVSQGGALPDEVANGTLPITRAVMTLWKLSPSDDGIIEFHRVIGEDNFSGDFWQEDDFWANMVEVLIPDPGGDLQEYPFYGDFLDPDGDGINTFFGDPVVGEIAPMPEFTDNERIEGGITYGAAIDSEDILGDLEDAVLEGQLAPIAAVQRAFFNFDVTQAVQDWVVDGQVNAGWAITNNSGDGWNIATSESEGDLDHAFFDGETVVPGVDPTKSAPLPFGLLYGDEPGSLLIDASAIRPQLTIFFEGAGGPADLDLSGTVDPDDVRAFLDNFGIEIEGIIDIGATGDLDFDRDVDPDDWLLFQAAYLEATNVASAIALGNVNVPEPSAGLLAIAGLAGAATFRRRASARARNVKRAL